MTQKDSSCDIFGRYGFTIKKSTFVKAIGAEVREIEHAKSGARIVNVYAPDRENCFCIALSTPPPDDTGMPHILEHMTLAGSEKFPCKEPFFEMIKRSVATFINAMTGNDITYYPVSSTVKKDLFNLADVYFDAVFHPLLTKETFAREAHHLAPADPGNPLGKLKYDGIVYSEMKGVFSSPEGILERDCVRKLLPDTCHGKESGGNPDDIPSLTHEALREFHKKAYHPSNGCIVLYGDIPVEDWLEFLAPRLDFFDAAQRLPVSPRQPRWDSPRRYSGKYPIPENEDAADKTYLSLNWLVGDMRDLDFVVRLTILSQLLIGNNAAPLKKAIVDSHIGSDLIASGSSSNGLEMSFHLTLEGAEADKMDEFVKVVESTLASLAQKPFDRDLVDAAFQLSVYDYSEIKSYHALETAALVVGCVLKDIDPVLLLDRKPAYDAAIAKIKEDPMILPGMIKKLLLDNSHRLEIILSPDKNAGKEEDERLDGELEKIRGSLSRGELEKIASDAAALEKLNGMPNTDEDLARLPSLNISDIPPVPAAVPFIQEKTSYGGHFLATDNLATNNIVYLLLSFDVADLPEDLWIYLSRYADAVSELGTENCDFAATTRKRATVLGDLSVGVKVTSHVSDPDAVMPTVNFSIKTTVFTLDEALERLREAIFELDPFDKSRIADILKQDRTACRAGIVQDARNTAYVHSGRKINQIGHMKNLFGGKPMLDLLERLNKIGPEEAYRETTEKIVKIRDFLLNPHRVNISLAAPDELRGKILKTVEKWLDRMADRSVPGAFSSSFAKDLAIRREGLSAALKVSFSSLVLPAPGLVHPDSIPLSIGSSILSSEYMLPEIRFKGNAYGAGMAHHPESGILAFMTYRDPQIAKSYGIMAKTADFAKNFNWTKEITENAILTIARKYEKPIRPSEACQTIYSWIKSGYTQDLREKTYAETLSATPKAVKETTIGILESSFPMHSYAVAASEEELEKAQNDIPGLTVTPIIES